MEHIEINPSNLILTNECIDMEVVESMVKGLLGGVIRPKDLTIPFVAYVEGVGWCVNDGNHTVKALQLAHIDKIEVDTYDISKYK